MKLIRFGNFGKEKPGICIDGENYDVSAFGEDYNEQFFETDGIKRLEQFVAENRGNLKKLPSDVRLGSPVARPSKIICIGLNYADHAKETGATPPPEPVVFMKATTSLCGPFDNVTIPKNSKKTDWEVELALVIGKKTQLY